MRTCMVCRHPRREDIDRQLLAQVPYRIIASQFGISQPALGRHRRNHLEPIVAKSQAAKESVYAESLWEHLEALRRKVSAMLAFAEGTNQIGVALQCIREVRGLIETTARIQGQIRETINITIHPEWLRIRAAILEVLEGYPEARDRLLDKLRAFDAGD